MTTGFQQQHQGFGQIVKSAAKPQHVGAKLSTKSRLARVPAAEPKSFGGPRK